MEGARVASSWVLGWRVVSSVCGGNLTSIGVERGDRAKVVGYKLLLHEAGVWGVGVTNNRHRHQLRS